MQRPVFNCRLPRNSVAYVGGHGARLKLMPPADGRNETRNGPAGRDRNLTLRQIVVSVRGLQGVQGVQELWSRLASPIAKTTSVQRGH